MTKRKASAYNRHVGREMRAGKTMKQAAASWRGGGAAPRTRTMTKRRRSTQTRKKTMTSKGGLRIGGFGLPGILKAGAVYGGTLFLTGRVAPQVQAVPGGVEAVAGGVSMVTGLPGAAFLALGATKFVASYLLRAVGGNGGGVGGYDY